MNTKLKIAIALLASAAFNANAAVYTATATGTIKAISNFGGNTSVLADLLGVYPQVGQRFVETVSVTVPRLVEDPVLEGSNTMFFSRVESTNVSVSFTIGDVTKAFSLDSGSAFIKYLHAPGWGDSYEISADLYDSRYSRFTIGLGVGSAHMWDRPDPSKNYVFNSSQASGNLLLSVRDTDFIYSGTVEGVMDTISISAVPEPGTYGMMLVGFALLGGVARRNKKAA